MDTQDLDLDRMRELRLGMIATLCTNDKAPTDKEDRDFLLKLMDGVDRSALNRKRLKTENKITDAAAQAMALISEIYRLPNVKTLGQGDVIEGVLVSPPILEDGLAEIRIAEGELEINPPLENFDQFVSRTGFDRDQT